MYSTLRRHKELLPLLGLVGAGLSFSTSMFLYKMYANPNLRLDKKERQKVLRDFQ